MFYSITNLFLSNTDPDKKTLRMFLIGTFCYIIFLSFIYSNYGERINLINKYKHYAFYLLGVDVVLSTIIVKLRGKTVQVNEKINLQRPQLMHLMRKPLVLRQQQKPVKKVNKKPKQIKLKSKSLPLKTVEPIEQIKQPVVTIEQPKEESKKEQDTSPFITKAELDKENDVEIPIYKSQNSDIEIPIYKPAIA